MSEGVKVSLSIDKQCFNKKPNSLLIGAINNRLPNSVEELSVGEMAKQVVRPYSRTFCPAVFKNKQGERNNNNWNRQQVFALDIDENLTIHEALHRCETYHILPSFIYTSFNHSEECQRFRIVFILDEEVRDIRVRHFVQMGLMTIFPEGDKSTKDAARMFFGGKDIVYHNYDNFISVPIVRDASVLYIKTTSGTNESREMTKFCKMTGINMNNGLPYLELINSKQDLKGRDLSLNTYTNLKKNEIGLINIYRRYPKKIQYYLLHFSDRPEQYIDRNAKFEITKFKSHRNLVQNYDFGELEDTCRLFRESKCGNHWLFHSEMFGIMTNLLTIKGGAKWVEQILTSRPEYASYANKWNAMLNQIQKSQYAPTQCENYCPYALECDHGTNMVEQGKLFQGQIQVIEEQARIPKEEAEQRLKQMFEEAMNDEYKGIYIIKAPTGLGKTEAYVQAAKYKNLTIAVPTHRLKAEVANRMHEAGLHFLAVPDIPHLEREDRERIDRMYAAGAYRAAHRYLLRLAHQSTKDSEAIKSYLATTEKIRKARNTTILTTHHRVLNADNPNDTLIIDEDIIPALFPQSNMTIADFMLVMSRIMAQLEDHEDKRMLQVLRNKVLDAPLNIVQPMDSCLYVSAEKIEGIVAVDSSVQVDILGLLNCLYFAKSQNLYNKTEYISFVRRKSLPNKKIIIMSATINETIAKLAFGNNVKFSDVGLVEQKGSIIQIPMKSFSRASINQNKDEMQFLKKVLIHAFNPDSYEISYKNLTEISFGNVSGIDFLKGKNITIVGTPNLNQVAYLLFSAALGFTLGLNDSVMEYRLVKRNGYRFRYQTFGNSEILQDIQFYMVETELLQAVGRARTLRHEAKVLVLSNLPVPSAEFIHLKKNDVIRIKNDYLKVSSN
ncbi:hypothetical protein [Paenibacillus xylanexedens]|uniref:hypothetical protein n=1 Tax=Paenibacillus xylanexedens TaxID=528191 RepID=UPI0011A15909|nr:hypothetical protein [Paenibacillus xylanexedens]